MFEICDRYRHLGRGDADYECFKYPYRFIDPSVFRLSLQVKKTYARACVVSATFFSPLIRK